MNENTMPLKWHNFLIYFSLWVGAILTLGYSAAFFTGSVYGEVGRRFYLVFPVMQWVDIAYGLVLVGISAFQFYTRFQLAAFRRGAPQKLLILFALSPIIQWPYMIVLSIVTGVSLSHIQSLSRFISELAGAVLFVVLNKIYYDKRKDLFVN